MTTPIYLDYNATTPLDPRVLEAMLPYFTGHFGNAASTTHPYGWTAEAAVKIAREDIARLIGAVPEEISFTSGATEALNAAIKGVAATYATRGNHIITLATEHKAVLDTCTFLEQSGFRVTRLPVDADGRLRLSDLEAALDAETLLVITMLANNETGVLQDLPAIAALTHAAGALLLTDATQAVGKIPVHVDALGVDLLACSAHKFYGPKGVGALYLRRRNPRVRILPLLHGGGHERGVRSGTLNVPGIVGMAAAANLSAAEMSAESARLRVLRDRLEDRLLALPEVRRNGHPQARLAHTSNLSFGFVEADALIQAMRGLAVSTGSACTSASMEPSHVLQAMGLSDDAAYAAIRFSLGRMTTSEEVDAAIAQVEAAIARLRALNPAWQAQQKT
jgi:cysteine desulfurase